MRYLPLLLVFSLVACKPGIEQTQALSVDNTEQRSSSDDFSQVYRVGGLDFKVVEVNFTPGIVYLALQVGNPTQETLIFQPEQISATIDSVKLTSDLSKLAEDKLDGEISPGMEKLIIIPFRTPDNTPDLKGTKEIQLKLGKVLSQNYSLRGEFDQLITLE